MNDEKLPYFGRPPARQPRPATEVKSLRGKRVILSLPTGFVYDIRAVSDVVTEADERHVRVVSEEDYFRWMIVQTPPTATLYPVCLVWVE